MNIQIFGSSKCFDTKKPRDILKRGESSSNQLML